MIWYVLYPFCLWQPFPSTRINKFSHYSHPYLPVSVFSPDASYIMLAPFPPFTLSCPRSAAPRPPSIFIPFSPGRRCHLSARPPTAEEFIPESGRRPYWGKVRGFSGNHAIGCVFVCEPPLCFHERASVWARKREKVSAFLYNIW